MQPTSPAGAALAQLPIHHGLGYGRGRLPRRAERALAASTLSAAGPCRAMFALTSYKTQKAMAISACARAIYAAGGTSGRTGAGGAGYRLVLASGRSDLDACRKHWAPPSSGQRGQDRAAGAMTVSRRVHGCRLRRHLKVFSEAAAGAGRLRRTTGISVSVACPRLRELVSAGRGLPVLCHGRSGPDRLRNQRPRGLVLDEQVIVEIVRPGTGDPCRKARWASWSSPP